MKRIVMSVIMGGLLLTTTHALFGIEGLKLTVQCPDVVLSWPSLESETYIVQYRPTLDTNSIWTTLTNWMPAATGTNVTTFVHPNQVDCPVGQVFGLMGSNGSLDETTDPLTQKEQQELLEVFEAERLLALLERCELEGREPWVWELENRPPYPWEATSKTFISNADGDGLDPESSEPPQTGFYRVVRNGAAFFGLTNGTVVSGMEYIPVEVGDISGEFSGVSLFIGTSGAAGVIVDTNELGQWVLEWDTTLTPNGTYDIHLEADIGPEVDALVGPTRSVTVDNNVSTDEFMTSFGSQMWIYAELKPGAGDYEIQIYDGETEEYLGSFYDSTSDGIVSFTWDLTDGEGGTFTNETFREDYYLFSSESSASTSFSQPVFHPPTAQQLSGMAGPESIITFVGNIFRKKEKTWGSDYFVTAAGEFDYPAGTVDAIDEMMQISVNDILTNPLDDHPYTLNPPNGWNTGSSFYLEPAKKALLLDQLANPLYRNFFWFGHGRNEGIGYSYRDASQNPLPGVGITASELRKALDNKGKIQHGYRLVFLHSCYGGSGSLPRAFGIDPRPLLVAHYVNKGMKARAFVGATEEATGIYYPEDYLRLGASLTRFFGSWMVDFPVENCLESAQAPEGPGENRIPLDSVFTVVGATDLTRSSQ